MGRIYDATWGRAFAALYDRGFEGDRRGRAAARCGASCSPQARGRVIELGAGTGAQPRALSRGGRGAGPDRARPAHGRSSCGRSWRAGRGREVIEAPAEAAARSRTPASTPPSSPSSSARSPTRAAALAEVAARAQAGRPAALPRARPRRGARPGPLAGPAREALALPRRRLPLQPRHAWRRSPPRGFELGEVERDRAAEGAADRPAAGPRQRACYPEPTRVSAGFEPGCALRTSRVSRAPLSAPSGEQARRPARRR